MKRTILLLILTISFSAYSQKINFSISASYNQTIISDIKETMPSSRYSLGSGYSNVFYSKINENYKSNSGAKIQGNISYQINTKLFVESGLQISMHRYNRISEIEPIGSTISDDFILGDADTSGIIIGDFPIYTIENEDKIGDTRTVYTEIPIKLGYSFFNSKLKCKIGIISSFLAYADVYEFQQINTLYEISADVKRNKTADGFKNLMFNGNVEIDYLVYRNIGLNLSYSYSLNSIYDDNVSVGKPKYNLLSLGLSYNFIKND